MPKKPRCPRCGSDSRVPDLVWTSCSHPWHQMAASPAPAQEPCVWLVTDSEAAGAGNPDLYGIFSSRARAEAWVARQRERGYTHCLTVEDWPLDEHRDLLLGPLLLSPSTPSREDHSGDGSR